MADKALDVKVLIGCHMIEDFLHQPEIDLIRRLCFAERSKESIQFLNRVILRIERIIIRSAGEHEHFLIVQNVGTGRIQSFGIVNLDVFRSIFHLCNDCIVRCVYIREQLIKRLVNKDTHHSRIAVIAEHTAVLPHGICLRLFARPGVVDRMECRESYAAPKRIAADDDIGTGRIFFTGNIILAVHHKHLYFIVYDELFRLCKYGIKICLYTLLRIQCLRA